MVVVGKLPLGNLKMVVGQEYGGGVFLFTPLASCLELSGIQAQEQWTAWCILLTDRGYFGGMVLFLASGPSKINNKIKNNPQSS